MLFCSTSKRSFHVYWTKAHALLKMNNGFRCIDIRYLLSLQNLPLILNSVHKSILEVYLPKRNVILLAFPSQENQFYSDHEKNIFIYFIFLWQSRCESRSIYGTLVPFCDARVFGSIVMQQHRTQVDTEYMYCI